MTIDTLPDWVRPGATYRWHKRKFHVRGIVDGQAVVREWCRTKQCWYYSVEDAIFFDVCRASIKMIEAAPSAETDGLRR